MKKITFEYPKNDIVETVSFLVLDQLYSNGEVIGKCELKGSTYYIEQIENVYESDPRRRIPDELFASERKLSPNECYKKNLKINFLCHSIKDLHYIYVYEQINH